MKEVLCLLASVSVSCPQCFYIIDYCRVVFLIFIMQIIIIINNVGRKEVYVAVVDYHQVQH